MIIQTLEKGYTLIKHCSADAQMERYVCRDNSDGQICTVIRIKDKELISNVIGFITREVNNPQFTDLEYCFVSEEFLHVVFPYCDNLSLAKKLQVELCSLKERIEIVKGLLEKITIQNMHPFFQCDCLKIERIIVYPTLEVSFQYEMDDLGRYLAYTFEDVKSLLRQIIEYVFSEEINKKMIPILNEFHNSFLDHRYECYLDVYKNFIEVCSQIELMEPKDLKIPKTKIFILWEKVKKTLKPMKRILLLVLILLAVFYLVYSIKQTQSSGMTQRVFQYIGTLEIEE